jgi:pyrroloquinoline quinone biosynthesis protein E
MSDAIALGPATRPRLAAHVRLRFDAVRGGHVLLTPEKVSTLDDIAADILARCTGQDTIAEIAAALGRRYAADSATIAADVVSLLAPLAEARFLDDGAPRHEPASPTPGVGPHPLATTHPVPPPVGLLAELTHRCPLQCVYCSNSLELEDRANELSTDEWREVLRQAAALGILQVHLSGGEPTLRRDLTEIIEAATAMGLYANLITAGINLTPGRLEAFRRAGLPHVQLSVQAASEPASRTVSGFRDALAHKRRTAEAVRDAGMALTVNAPVHRLNLDGLEAIIAFALEVDAHRLEVAHVQYYGWAALNRAHLLPTPDQVRCSIRIVEAAREAHAGHLAIDFVVPDQHAVYPKPCMGGWGRKFVNITPSGLALPCHAAQSIAGLAFDSVRDRPLEWIWREGTSFNAFRGTGWMAEPCATCERRERDWGGCRCQAFAVLGDAAATDPACSRSPHQARFRDGDWAAVSAPPASPPGDLAYRRASTRPPHARETG